MASTNRNPGALISAFDALLGPRIEQPPEGFFTVQELAQRKGFARGHMENVLADLLAAKKITRARYRNSNGRVCWFYGITSAKSTSGAQA